MNQAFSGIVEPAAKATRVALLVDGDNIGPAHAGQMINAALRMGPLAIRRVYGNAALLPGWDAAPGFALVHAGCGKNAADLLLTVEAMALAYAGRADAFVIVTSDRDFTHLATHLRECGHHVLGLGEAKAPERLRKAFSAFREIAGVMKAEVFLPVAAPKADPRLDPAIRLVIAAHGMDGSIGLAPLGSWLGKDHGLTRKATGHATWSGYFATRPAYGLSGTGSAIEVRLRA